MIKLQETRISNLTMHTTATKHLNELELEFPALVIAIGWIGIVISLNFTGVPFTIPSLCFAVLLSLLVCLGHVIMITSLDVQCHGRDLIYIDTRV